MATGQILSLEPLTLQGLSNRTTNRSAQCYVVDESPSLDAGYVTSEQQHRYFLWNGSDGDAVVSSIDPSDESAAVGISWDAALPLTVLAHGSEQIILAVLAEGPVEYTVDFSFIAGCSFLPVFTVTGTRAPQLSSDVGYLLFPHNWEDGLDETLAWKTDVMIAHDRTEQRVKLRSSPRRSWDLRLLVSGAGRRKLETWLGMRKSRSLFIPIWRDVSITQSVAESGATMIPVAMSSDNYIAGTQVAIWTDWQTFNIRTITGVGAGYVSVDTPLSRDWPVGANVGPCRYCLSLETRRANRFTEDVSDYRLRVTATDDLWSPSGVEPETYNDLHVCPFVPNWEDGDESYDNKWVQLDSDTGIIEFDVQSEEPVMSRDARFLLIGRDNINMFLAFIADRAGRLAPFWLQANDRGFELAEPASADDSEITIEPIGYEYALSDSNAREHIELKTVDGTVIRQRITAVQTLPNGNEQLTLGSAIPVDISASTLDRCSWLELVRLDSDEIALHWLTAECVEVTVPIVVLP